MENFIFSQFVREWFPSFGLIIFLTIFVIMIAYVFKKTTGIMYSSVEQLPFDEGSKNE